MKIHKIVSDCISFEFEKIRRKTNMKKFLFFLGFLKNQVKPKAKKIIHWFILAITTKSIINNHIENFSSNFLWFLKNQTGEWEIKRARKERTISWRRRERGGGEEYSIDEQWERDGYHRCWKRWRCQIKEEKKVG